MFDFLCSNFTYTGPKTRLPASFIGAAIRHYWPGFYTPPIPGGQPKIATTWADYEMAPAPDDGTAADAVKAKFWVMHNS